MFVRWKRTRRATPRRNYGIDRGDTISAVLVKSERTEGKPRQKIVAYLGSIREKRIGQVYDHLFFWDTVESKIDRLGLPSEQGDKIKTIISHKVGYIPPDKRAELRDGLNVWLKGKAKV